MRGNSQVRCGAGENLEITSKDYLSLYFAPSSKKSWNYTSYRGTYWAKGNDDVAFMGLYAVAYGKPLDVHTHSITTDYKAMTLNGGYDCLHAHKGSALLNDEIIFYDEAAMVLNYIVEFE